MIRIKRHAGRLKAFIFPPMPGEPKAFQELIGRTQSDDYPEECRPLAELVIRDHRSLWRTKKLLRRSNIENRVLYLIAIGSVVASFFLLGKIDNVSQQQLAGRKISLGVTCSALSAVIDAGRTTIGNASQLQPSRLRRNLERLGYPSLKVRQAAASKAAEIYAQSITDRVDKATGKQGIIRSDGTLDCKKLGQVAKVPIGEAP